MKQIWVWILVWACFGSAVAFAEDAGTTTSGEREECRVCGMWIDQYQRTAAELVYKDGRKEHTCGVVCMFRILEDEGFDAFSAVTVRDFHSGAVVDAREASYSIGSRVIPDMIPNIIAFKDRASAEAFQAKEGGEVIDFEGGLQIITPRGQTVPFRLQTAVTTGKGSFGLGAGFGYLRRDDIKLGSDSRDPRKFIKSRPQQPRAPSKMESYGQSLFVNYGITDRLALLANLPYFEKETSRYEKNLQTGEVRTIDADAAGLGDLDLRFRYNLWRNAIENTWVTATLTTTIPTGRFNKAFIDSPALQSGAGAPSVGGGLLFSYSWRDLWFHSSATYTGKLRNGDEYRFGNEAAAGIALHYTPRYDYMFGIEADAIHAEKNEFKGVTVGNTGGTRVNLTFVADWRFLLALGGNWTLRAAIGLPIHEDLNRRTIGPREQVQLGGGFFANAAVTYATRFPFFEE